MQTTIRKDCPNAWDRGGYWHTREATGRATRCRYCSAVLTARRGWWGVFAWTGTGVYTLEDVVRRFRSKEAAEEWTGAQMRDATDAYLNAGPGGLVVRWIDALPEVPA